MVYSGSLFIEERLGGASARGRSARGTSMGRRSIWALAPWGAALVLYGAGCGGSGTHQDPAPAVGGAAYEHHELDAYQVYLVGGSGAPFAMVTRVVASSPTGFTRRFTGQPGDVISESEYTFADGIGLAASSIQLPGSTAATRSTFSPPEPILPADLRPGAVTSVSSLVTSGATTARATRTCTVDGVEPVTVPAGTFQALKVTTDLTQTGGVSQQLIYWWVPGMGRIKVRSALSSAPTAATTQELVASGVGALPPFQPDGRYRVTGVTCRGGANAPAPLAALIASPSSMRLQLAGAVASTAWSDGTCTITQPGTVTSPAAGQVSVAPGGPFACAPSAGACAALSAATFGVDVCGQTDQAGARIYLLAPGSTPVGGRISLTRIGGQECSALGGLDPVTYALTRE